MENINLSSTILVTHMTTITRLILVFSIFCMLPSRVHAIQKDSIIIVQYVRDSFTRYGIRNAFVTIMDTMGNIVDTTRTMPASGGHDGQIWSIIVPRKKSKFRIKVQHPDYETKEMQVEMEHPARLNSYAFPEILLKRSFVERETDLGEVTVKATRVKLCYKGDTLEVDARAFQLSEGSMLESLVRNIPGAELDDNGDIYMNGKKVDYLTLNGKDFFKGNNRIMLDNLPYYTVDKLQFFHQRSERSQLLGRDVEHPDYVMNVKLKQEYNIGYISNLELGAGTSNRWLGRGFALRFTDNSRLSLYGNVNNINERRKPGGDGAWGVMNTPEGDTKTYNLGGEWLVDDKQGRYKETLNATFLWNRSKEQQRISSQLFLQQGDAFRYDNELTYNKGLSLSANNHLALKRLGVISDTRFTYSDFNNHSLARSVLFSQRPSGNAEQIVDSVFSTSQSSEIVKWLVNHTEDKNTTDGYKWSLDQNIDYHKELPWGDDIMFAATGTWDRYKYDVRSHYWLKYQNEEANDENQDRYTHTFSHSYKYNVKATYAIHFLTDWHLNISLAHHQRSDHFRKDLYRLDWDENLQPDEILPSQTDYLRLRDESNSPHSKNTLKEEHITGVLHRHNYNSRQGRYFSFSAQVDASYVKENGRYSRGLQTVALTDCRWLINPSVDVEYETRNWHDAYQFHYDTKMRSPNLEQMADMTDTSNPLAVQKGNPNLRPSQIHNASFSARSRFGSHGQFVLLRSDVSIKANLVAMNSIYDPTSGVYTYIPVNVNGNWTGNNVLEMRRALTANRQLNVESRTTYDYVHGVDMKDNAKSIVAQQMVGQNCKLEYKRQTYIIALSGGVMWREVRTYFHNVDFNYGASLQMNLPGNLHLSTDMKMYGRRRYADRSLCTDNLVWNAQLDYALCKGRLLFSVKGFDLLHQISSTYSSINSQARVETWRLSLPSYFMFSVQYKFNKNPKKR